jgi:DNA-binding CsgD family transcriptional regulator
VPVGRRDDLMGASRWPLVGRQAACEAITAALVDEDAGGIVIAGPAGVGRTRVLHEALFMAGDRGRPVRWAAATSAATHVPLGALAHLLPAVDVASDSLVLLQRASQAIAGDGSERPPVLGVDDVHLLDPLSVTLLHQLATSGAVTLVLAVRTGNAAPDPAAPLWKDRLVTRIELQPLSRDETERLLTEVLSGDVEARTTERLWRLTQGNPLFLRELVEDGRRTGRLGLAGGLWRWDGPLAPPQRLVEIVLAHMGDLSSDQRRVLEVLSTAEPLAVQQVVDLSSADAVASLQHRGVVVDADSGATGQVRIAHPLYTEVVRGRASEAGLRLIRQQLADRQGYDSLPDDLVRRCTRLLDSDAPMVEHTVLTRAARYANAMLDHPGAERLARAAVEAGADARAHVALVEASWWQGQPALGERLVTEAASVSGAGEDRVWLTATRVLALFCGLQRRDDAAALLKQAAAEVRTEEDRAVVSSIEATLAFLGGDPARALRHAAPVLSSGTGAGAAQPIAAAAAATSLAVTGQTAQALATVETGWRALDSLTEGPHLAFVWVWLTGAEVLALHLAGRIEQLEQRVSELHRKSLAAPEWPGDAVVSLFHGWAAMAAGRLRLAIRWLIEAQVGLQRRDPVGLLPLCLSLLARARAVIGDVAGAEELLADRERIRHGAVTVFDPAASLAWAWLEAARGRTAKAGEGVLEAAALAADQGQLAVEALLLHDGLRFGRAADVVLRLRQLAATLDSPFVEDLAAHAEAVQTGSGELLERQSHRFEEAGALLFAADAAQAASSAYKRSGDRRRAAHLASRVSTLIRACGLAETPALDHVAPPLLTSREEEVARLADRGMSNQAIADRLVVSVRTVETHLTHIYTKLGISGRADLARALATVPTQPRRR